MNDELPAPGGNRNPLALSLKALGHLVQDRRETCGFSIADAAELLDMPVRVLSRIEVGEPVGTDVLVSALNELGLAMLVLPKLDVSKALHALGLGGNWHGIQVRRLPTAQRTPKLDGNAAVSPGVRPTLFLSFDGTLHVGHALLDTSSGEVTLDSGREPFEYVPLLAEMLKPYPEVEIVLTTGWLRTLSLDKVLSYLPHELAHRVVETT